MCFFVFVATPTSDVDRVKTLFARGFQVHPTANLSVLKELPSGYVARIVTRGGCSCDMYGKSDSTAGLHQDVVKRLVELCEGGSGIAISVHWFKGDAEAEKFSLTRSSCDCGSLSVRAAALQEDELLIAQCK
jgi:hypothetical protein